jgi:hypothetical protein
VSRPSAPVSGLGGPPLTVLNVRDPKRDGSHGSPSAAGAILRARHSWELAVKMKVLLVVLWIALAAGIAALIVFPPDSVLTAEFRR